MSDVPCNMAALSNRKMSTLSTLVPIVNVIFAFALSTQIRCFDAAPILSPPDILRLSKSKCIVALSSTFLNMKQTKDNADDRQQNLLDWANMAFWNEANIVYGVCDFENFQWPSGKKLNLGDFSERPSAVVFPRMVEDRTCLLEPEGYTVHPEALPYGGLTTTEAFVEFVNSVCNTFRRIDGDMTIEGLHRESILEQLFHVQELKDSVTISDIFRKSATSKQCEKGNYVPCQSDLAAQNNVKPYQNIPECERIPMPSKDRFFNDFLARSKPVIITGAMDHWIALVKWTNDFFRKHYGDRQVHVQLTPKGEYEGVEAANIWDSFATFKIPTAVIKKLPYPDLVVVRPATTDIKFSDFLDLIGNVSEGLLTNFSAYLEYTSVSDYFPDLKEDITEMLFIQNVLSLKHLNIWLSDGNTLGKTHFDPFDNFLCQISGSKELTLFEPYNNELLYEAHIPEALLSYNETTRQFQRSTLLDSTSMVMTPIDILNPNIERFPNFKQARPLSCTIKEGEVLFMPAFWWHEVQSHPSPLQKRNLAVNFWYEPFFTRQFPCPECQLDVNPQYRHLL